MTGGSSKEKEGAPKEVIERAVGNADEIKDLETFRERGGKERDEVFIRK